MSDITSVKEAEMSVVIAFAATNYFDNLESEDRLLIQQIFLSGCW